MPEIDQLIEHSRASREEIGHGEFGKVFKFTSNSRTYVVKEINPTDIYGIQLVDNEIKVLQHLLKYCSTYFLCFVNFHVTDKNKYSIITEYLDNYTTMTSYNPNISINELVKICEELKNGLRKLHENGVVHRDIHMGNIMICTKCPQELFKDVQQHQYVKGSMGIRIRFIDYGYACIDDRSKTCPLMKRSVYAYQSPQIYDQKPREKYIPFTEWKTNDMWSLGMCIFSFIGGYKSILYYVDNKNQKTPNIRHSGMTYSDFDETYLENSSKFTGFWSNYELTKNSIKEFMNDQNIDEYVQKYLLTYIYPLFEGIITMVPTGEINDYLHPITATPIRHIDHVKNKAEY